MSVIATLVDPVQRHTPFTGGTDQDRLLRGAARGETIFTKNDIWAAPGTGDNRSINFTCDLDNNFAWVLTDASCTFLRSGSGAMHLEAVGLLEIALPSNSRTEYIYGQFTSLPGRMDSVGSTEIGAIAANRYNTMYPVVTDVGSMTFDLWVKPNYMLIPFSQSGSQVVTVSNIFSETKTAGDAYSYRFAARFLQYDIDQAYDYRVQSPQLTR
jgi:hypothetical protein